MNTSYVFVLCIVKTIPKQLYLFVREFQGPSPSFNCAKTEVIIIVYFLSETASSAQLRISPPGLGVTFNTSFSIFLHRLCMENSAENLAYIYSCSWVVCTRNVQCSPKYLTVQSRFTVCLILCANFLLSLSKSCELFRYKNGSRCVHFT